MSNGQLKGVAIVLFGKDSGSFYPNIFVKIGKFEDDALPFVFKKRKKAI